MSPAVQDGVGLRKLSPDHVNIQASSTGGGGAPGSNEIRKPGVLDDARRKELEDRWRSEEDNLAKEEISNGLMVNAEKRVTTLEQRLDSLNSVHAAQIQAIDVAIEEIKERIGKAGDQAREADRNILDYYIKQKDDLELCHAQDVAFAVATASKNYPQPSLERAFPAPSAPSNPHARLNSNNGGGSGYSAMPTGGGSGVQPSIMVASARMVAVPPSAAAASSFARRNQVSATVYRNRAPVPQTCAPLPPQQSTPPPPSPTPLIPTSSVPVAEDPEVYDPLNAAAPLAPAFTPTAPTALPTLALSVQQQHGYAPPSVQPLYSTDAVQSILAGDPIPSAPTSINRMS